MIRSLLLTMLICAPARAVELEIVFAGFPDASAPIVAGLFDNADAFDRREGPIRDEAMDISGESLIWRPRPVDPGQYAVLAFQDLNQNGILDMDDRGRPLEPYTATGRLGRREPAFRQSAVRLDGAHHRIELDQWRFRKRRSARP